MTPMRCPLDLYPDMAACPRKSCVACMREYGNQIMADLTQVEAQNACLKQALFRKRDLDLRNTTISVIFAAYALMALVGRTLYEQYN